MSKDALLRILAFCAAQVIIEKLVEEKVKEGKMYTYNDEINDINKFLEQFNIVYKVYFKKKKKRCVNVIVEITHPMTGVVHRFSSFRYLGRPERRITLSKVKRAIIGWKIDEKCRR